MNLSESQLHALTRSEVLALSFEEKMEYFHALQVSHREIEKVAKDLMELLSQHNETNILFIIGPTGVGKTTLVKRLIKSIVQKNYSENGSDPSLIPFIYISAPANGDRSLSWVSIYTKILQEANEILIEKKHVNKLEKGTLSISPKNHRTLAALRDALDSMLKHRQVRVLIIDEAYHLLRFGNYQAVMDTLKSITDETGVKLVLLGSYNLFELATQYGQVARRAEVLHFRRYEKDRSSDVTGFKATVEKFEQYWPCKEVPKFSAITIALMEASLGCVGLLKVLLLQSLSFQLKKGEKWDPHFLVKAAKSMKLLTKIREEIEEGESKLVGATYGDTLFSGKMLDDVIMKMGKEAVNV